MRASRSQGRVLPALCAPFTRSGHPPFGPFLAGVSLSSLDAKPLGLSRLARVDLMSVLFVLLGVLALLGGLACSIVILVDAFRDAIWKGVLSLLCGLYGLYYALFEFEHEWKWPIVLGAMGGGTIAAGLFKVASGQGI